MLHGARHRDWSGEERNEILREAFSPGACVSHVARRYDVSRRLIYNWRRTALRQTQEAFVLAVIEDDVDESSFVAPTSEPTVVIVLELTDGQQLRISAVTPPAFAAAALQALQSYPWERGFGSQWATPICATMRRP